MLSIITAGRDDNYGNNFLDRFYISIENNLKFLHKKQIEYEYFICEWNPQNKILIENPKFKNLFIKYNLKEIIITNKVVEKENLMQNIFYEYFAKNSGIRNASYNNLLIVNSDIIIPEDSFEEIKNIVKQISDRKFYRLRYRQQVEIENIDNIILSEDIYKPEHSDSVICGYYSGDLLLINKETLIKYGQGYDETNSYHRTISQSGMDGEILWNLHNSGIKIDLIPKSYIHINHGRFNPRDGIYNDKGYINKQNWGFIDYNKKYLYDNKIIVIE